MKVLEGFAGPGGFSEAARMIGLTGGLGVELNTDACATAEAAGHARTQDDIRDLDPADFPDVEGWVSGPPCPPFADSGLRSGVVDYRAVLDGVVSLADWTCHLAAADDWTAVRGLVSDDRTALVLETLRFAFRLPNVRWIVAEQVPAVHGIWEEMCAELAAVFDFESCNVVTVRADDLGLPTRRRRVFLVACRDYTPDFSGVPMRSWWSCGRWEAPHLRLPASASFPRTTMAAALDWSAGVVIRTRGNRKTSGGNLFSADGPALGLTEKARSWTREDTGTHALTAAEAGLLQGFSLDYPWQGSRSARFRQVADTVSPLMGAAVLGAAAGVPWEASVRDRLERLYGRRGHLPPSPEQLDLFAGAAA